MKYYETEKVELKEKVNDQLIKEIEAFLNTDGGTIYVGVKDDGSVVGIDDIDSSLKKISDIISDQIEPNAINCVKPEVIFEGEKVIIKINVTKGYSTLYCIKKYGFSPNGCHYRIGTTCKSMTLEMIKKEFEKGLLDFDLMIKMPAKYSEISFNRLKLFFTEKGYHLDENSFETNLYLRNKDGSYNFLAELLSDKNMTPLIFAKFKTADKSVFSDRSDFGNQCIINAYEQIKDRIRLENVCKTITDPRPRKDIYLYNTDAVNEALINAIVHNDYRISEPQVSFFSDRLEILSHGGLPIGMDKDDFFMGVSRPRNSHLMNIFVRLGIVEHTGHGVPTIIKTYGRDIFTIKDNYILVSIPFNSEVVEDNGVLSGAINGVISGAINPSGQDLPLTDEEKMILNMIMLDKTKTAKDISTDLKIPFRSVQRYISNLKSKGKIAREGSKKSGYWVVPGMS